MLQTRPRDRFRPPVTLAAVLVGAVVLGGCSWLTPLIYMGQHKEEVYAEFNKLSGKTVAVAVWADQETLFDYPHVRMELGLHIADRLWSNVPDIKLVDGRRIEDHMQRNLANSVDPIDIGKRFDSEMVIYAELLDFQIRNPDSPEFLDPRIYASITVYDLTADPDEPKQYELLPVEVDQPEALFNDTSAQIARKALYEQFADTVAKKFYDHKVDMVK